MGTDKGLLVLNGRPLVTYIISALQKIFEEVVIVSGNDAYRQFGLPVINDQVTGIGPAGGVHAALTKLKTEKAFIISCDMPFITSDAVKCLLESSEDAEISLALHDGELQPLFGVYHRDCLEKWESLIRSGNYKMRELVKHFRLSSIDTKNFAAFSDVVFMNLNDKSELDKAQKLLQDEN